MAKLIYIAIASLDGYIKDEGGRFDWAAPDEEVHTFRQRLIATGWHLPLAVKRAFLFGRIRIAGGARLLQNEHDRFQQNQAG